ncbi:hypothetical protein ACEPAG_2809 [Sanghuangporus baumii]
MTSSFGYQRPPEPHTPTSAITQPDRAHSNGYSALIEMSLVGSDTTLNENPHRDDRTRNRLSHMERGMQEFAHRVEHDLYLDEVGHFRRQVAWDRFKGKGMKKIGWFESIKNTATSSILNVLLVFIPIAWTIYFSDKSHSQNPDVVFALCFLAIVPLVKLFEFGGKQITFYTGKHVGDLIVVTLNNAVEVMLAIVLLLKCHLRILQATLVGVVLLHLLLVPGIGFLTGGARIYEQTLHPHYTQLNHTLLAVGVLSLLLPAAVFAALDKTSLTEQTLTGDTWKEHFLKMSYGISVLLLTVYIASRIFLHNPPREGKVKLPIPGPALETHDEVYHQKHKGPKVNAWFCSLFLLVNIAVMAVTAELLVTSVGHIGESGRITEEWFGLVLIPMVSFSADAFVTVVYFLRTLLFLKPRPPETLAENRAIDMSIQFTLFWTPLLVLLAWWMDKPLLLLFDMFEVTILLSSCFLVNYVLADSKTNWAEGYMMVIFYLMIILCAWYYTGQSTIKDILASCKMTEH